MLTLITVVSSAGGAGRSTVTAHLAAQLAQGEHPVAVVELDAQNSLGALLGLSAASEKGVLTLGEAPAGWRSLLSETPAKVPFLPAGRACAAQIAAFGEWSRREPAGLRRQLDALGLPDGTRVLIDTARLPGVTAQAAIAAADLVLGVVPVTTTGYVTQPDLMSAGGPGCQMVANFAAANSALGTDLMQMIQSRGGDAIVPVRIHRDDAVGTAAAGGLPLFTHGEGSQAALDILHLAAWLLRATARASDGAQEGSP
ncbi:Iron-sulfur cluster carrier protein [Pandoraea iniqua]|uniref:cellulose synthase operon protein YhjQ/BcsQ n=1 Tax=Pandoraea iniqua TaxID=2508288 RepID=UPI00124258A0|nr:cellulose synthase operon protein YhjQ/BcsQ [Pandoraea iniqua]VVE13842.1 Iron-sulfur cluster carrier protein [Pandoraea iniqua]